MTDDTRVVCATCRRASAKWLATHELEPDEPWPVCDRCRNQAERKSVLVSHEALDG